MKCTVFFCNVLTAATTDRLDCLLVVGKICEFRYFSSRCCGSPTTLFSPDSTSVSVVVVLSMMMSVPFVITTDILRKRGHSAVEECYLIYHSYISACWEGVRLVNEGSRHVQSESG